MSSFNLLYPCQYLPEKPLERRVSIRLLWWPILLARLVFFAVKTDVFVWAIEIKIKVFDDAPL